VRALLQRVARASVHVDGSPVASIGRGFLVLAGVGHDDGPSEAERLAEKIATLRVFADDQRKMNLALDDVGGEVLVVSQFTLYADVRKGRVRPTRTRPPPSRPPPWWRRSPRDSNAGASPWVAGCSARTCRSSS
jgi:D-tyrosyl-tRNA(Tyr) deacylase